MGEDTLERGVPDGGANDLEAIRGEENTGPQTERISTRQKKGEIFSFWGRAVVVVESTRSPAVGAFLSGMWLVRSRAARFDRL